MPAENEDWLSRGVGGFLWGHVERFVLHRRSASDFRRMDSIATGTDLDPDGLPVGAIPAEFIDRRPEAGLVYPGSRQVHRSVERGSGSTLARVLAFDSPAAAVMNAGYAARATPVEVVAWYRRELEARGWTSGRRSSLDAPGEVFQIFTRSHGRESLRVGVRPGDDSRPALERAGSAPLQPGEVFYSVTYRILVSYQDEQ